MPKTHRLFGLFSLPHDSVWPDYGDGGLLGLAQKLHAWMRGARDCPLPGSSGAPQTLIFWLIDGLGEAFLERFGDGSQLLAHRLARLTSVCPSTTASAVTSLATGLPPVQHGLVGWTIRDRRFGGNLMPLPLRRSGWRRIHAPFAVQRLFPYMASGIAGGSFARSWRVLLPPGIAGSPFSERHLQRGTIAIDPARLEQQIAENVAQLNATGGGMLYLYHTQFDALSHQFGPYSDEAQQEFQRLDQLFLALLPRLKAWQAQLLVTADHGFAETSPRRHVRLEQTVAAKMLDGPLFGEQRLAFCNVRRGMERDFAAFVRENLTGKAKLVSSEKLIHAGLFGLGARHPRLKERVGSHALLMEPGWIVSYRTGGERPHVMKGVHGGLSAAEMWVPLILAE